MHKRLKHRIIYASVFFFLLVLGISIILYNLSGNIAFFLTPTELLTKPIFSEIKLGGYAKTGSVKKIAIDEIEFSITDRTNDIRVNYKGAIPAIFREGQGVVVTGSYSQTGLFIAKELLAKHDEKYMPKNVKKQVDEEK